MIRYYDLDGNEVDEATGMALFKSTDTIVWDMLVADRGPVAVSTIFLSADHRHGGGGPPLIFETLTSHPDGPPDCERWSTLTEAREGHAAIVAKLRGGVR